MEPVKVEVLFDPCISGSAHLAPQLGIADQIEDRPGKPDRIAGGDEDARYAIDDDFRDAVHMSGHDGSGCCHRFQDAHRHRFAIRGEDDDIDVMEQVQYIGSISGEVNFVRKTQLRCQANELRLIFAASCDILPDQHQMNGLYFCDDIFHRSDQIGLPLSQGQSCYTSNKRAVYRYIERLFKIWRNLVPLISTRFYPIHQYSDVLSWVT